MKDNARLYRLIRLQRLQLKEDKENPRSHPTLETLAEAAVSLQPPETSQDAVNTPSLEHAKQTTIKEHFWENPNKF